MRRSLWTRCLIPAFVFFLGLLFQEFSLADEDVQYWSEYTLTYKIAPRVSVILNPSIRLKDDISENQYWESRQGLSFKATSALALNLQYLHSETKNAANKWLPENTIEFQPTYKWSWHTFDFANRLRIEYRMVGGFEKWRWRDQLKISRTCKVAGVEIIPFISDEIFYDEALDQMNQNRLRAGISKRVSPHALATFFYQYKTNAVKQDWTGEHILGTGLELSF